MCVLSCGGGGIRVRVQQKFKIDWISYNFYTLFVKLFNHVRALTQSWKQYPTILIAQRHDTSLEGPRKDLSRTRTRHKDHRREERRALGRARQTTDDLTRGWGWSAAAGGEASWSTWRPYHHHCNSWLSLITLSLPARPGWPCRQITPGPRRTTFVGIWGNLDVEHRTT